VYSVAMLEVRVLCTVEMKLQVANDGKQYFMTFDD
jgi:hypothetical protein